MTAELQELDEPIGADDSSVPLILIHDGGGTIFQYCMLGPLNRYVYGMPAPYFDDGRKPEGGVPKLAIEYVAAIRATIKSGPIIVGGWSFGGIISLEIARLLQDDPDLSVIGLIMIDSNCPWSKNFPSLARISPTFRETTSEKMKAKTMQAFSIATDLIRSWDRPPPFTAPPTVLLRATETRPLAESSRNSDVSAEGDGQLGWSAYDRLKITYRVDLPGNHFSIFEMNKLDKMTEEIRRACEHFEGITQPHAGRRLSTS